MFILFYLFISAPNEKWYLSDQRKYWMTVITKQTKIYHSNEKELTPGAVRGSSSFLATNISLEIVITIIVIMVSFTKYSVHFEHVIIFVWRVSCGSLGEICKLHGVCEKGDSGEEERAFVIESYCIGRLHYVW